MSFKELISSYTAGESNFEDLILDVRCESCFASMFEEVQQQLVASSQILEMLADEFPIYHQSFVKERNLEFTHENLSNHKSQLKPTRGIA